MEAPRSGVEYTPLYEGRLVRQKIDRENNFKQAGDLWREMTEEYKTELVGNIAGHLLNGVTEPVLVRAFEYWRNVDKQLGDRVEQGVRRQIHGRSRRDPQTLDRVARDFLEHRRCGDASVDRD